MHHQTWKLFGLSAVTAAALYLVNIIGFTDTMTHSLLGCGHQWPLCHGRLVPAHWSFHTVIEYGHRFIVLLTISLLVLTSVLAWKRYGRIRKIKLLIRVTIAAVAAESGLGAMTVFFNSPPYILALHMGVALTALTASVLMASTIWQIEHDKKASGIADTRFIRWVRIATVYAFVAIYAGAYVAKSGYGALFRGWPLPVETMRQALMLDLLHRSIAFGLFVLVGYLVVKSCKLRRVRPDLFLGSIASLVFTISQIFSGAALIITNVSIPAFLVHVSLASFLFISLAFLTFQTMRDIEKSERTISEVVPSNVVKMRKIQ